MTISSVNRGNIGKKEKVTDKYPTGYLLWAKSQEGNVDVLPKYESLSVCKTSLPSPTPAKFWGRKKFVESVEQKNSGVIVASSPTSPALAFIVRATLCSPVIFFSTANLLPRELQGQGQDLCLNAIKNNGKKNLSCRLRIHPGKKNPLLSLIMRSYLPQCPRLNQLFSSKNSQKSSFQELVCVSNTDKSIYIWLPLSSHVILRACNTNSLCHARNWELQWAVRLIMQVLHCFMVSEPGGKSGYFLEFRRDQVPSRWANPEGSILKVLHTIYQDLLKCWRNTEPCFPQFWERFGIIYMIPWKARADYAVLSSACSCHSLSPTAYQYSRQHLIVKHKQDLGSRKTTWMFPIVVIHLCKVRQAQYNLQTLTLCQLFPYSRKIMLL